MNTNLNGPKSYDTKVLTLTEGTKVPPKLLRRNEGFLNFNEANKATEYPCEMLPRNKITIIAVECTGRFSKDALAWCKDSAQCESERRRPPHLLTETTTNEQGTYDPEAIKMYHYNVAEAQLELHRQNMEWCIGAIAQARNKHVDVEPELDYRPDITW